MDQEKIIDDNVASYFVSNGQMGPVVERKRKFSTRLISSPSSTRSFSSVSAILKFPKSFRAIDRSTNVPFIEIPVTLFSVESYVYMSFTKVTAREIWNRYITRPHDMSDTFLDLPLLMAIFRPSQTYIAPTKTGMGVSADAESIKR